MNRKTKYSIALAMLIGVLAGGFLFADVHISITPKTTNAITTEQRSGETAAPPAADRQINTLRDLNDAFVEIAQNAKPSVVTVFTEKTVQRNVVNPFDFFGLPFDDFFGQPRQREDQRSEKELLKGLGSGVIVSADGYILTNNHVVAQSDTVYVKTYDGKTLPAKIIGTDPKTDIAVIKVSASNLTPIKIGSSDKLRVGEWVLAIGSPLGENLAETVTQGIVSAKGRSNVGLTDYEDFIQTDAAINPGNSGGPLLNIDGELVGINTAIASRTGGFQGIGFAVPSNMAQRVMESLIKYGKVTRGWLGITIQDIDKNIAKGMKLKSREGAIVGSVLEDSPSQKAGIQTGDVIIAVDGKKITNTVELRNMIAGIAPGTKVSLKVMRNGEEKEVSVKLGELPADEIVKTESKKKIEEVLGFKAATVTQSLASQYGINANRKGVVVTSIDRNSSAFRAGLQEGDLIISVNNKDVASVKDFEKLAGDGKTGDTLLLLVERKGNRRFVAFTQ
ncbi:MAG: DegQ family serine endoprotease [Chlorobiales bacterium]|nr:DegQ family serine endoprotease [Chlorobiales bacterium]